MAYEYRFLTREEQAAIVAARLHALEEEHYTRVLSLAANQELLKTTAEKERAQLDRWIAADAERIAVLEKTLTTPAGVEREP